MKFVLTEEVKPDHPWDDNKQVSGFCETCGHQQIVHDGNLDKVFDWMERAGRAADQVWWYIT